MKDDHEKEKYPCEFSQILQDLLVLYISFSLSHMFASITTTLRTNLPLSPIRTTTTNNNKTKNTTMSIIEQEQRTNGKSATTATTASHSKILQQDKKTLKIKKSKKSTNNKDDHQKKKNNSKQSQTKNMRPTMVDSAPFLPSRLPSMKRISAPAALENAAALAAAACSTTASAAEGGELLSPRSALLSPRSAMKKNDQQRRATIQIMERKPIEREIVLPNSDVVVKRTNSIRFSEQVRVKPIVPIKSIIGDDEDSLSQIWYTPDEFDEMKEQCAMLVEQMEESSERIVSLSEHDPALLQKILKSIRGLEKYLNAEEVLNLRYQAWDAVLDEQEYQVMDGYFDEVAIANAYKGHTLLSKMQAWERGQQDALQVQQDAAQERRQQGALQVQQDAAKAA